MIDIIKFIVLCVVTIIVGFQTKDLFKVGVLFTLILICIEVEGEK